MEGIGALTIFLVPAQESCLPCKKSSAKEDWAGDDGQIILEYCSKIWYLCRERDLIQGSLALKHPMKQSV